MITVTTFKWVPHFAQGLVRDLRVRWALEEAGLPYEIKLIGFEACDTPQYRALQPFGQAGCNDTADVRAVEDHCRVKLDEARPRRNPLPSVVGSGDSAHRDQRDFASTRIAERAQRSKREALQRLARQAASFARVP